MTSSKGVQSWGVKRFLNVLFKVRREYPMLWDNTTKRNRMIMVRYWMDGQYWCGTSHHQVQTDGQLNLWSV